MRDAGSALARTGTDFDPDRPGGKGRVRSRLPLLGSLPAASEWFLARPLRLIAVVALIVALPVLVLGEVSANDTRQRVRAERLQRTTQYAQRAATIMTDRTQSVYTGLNLLKTGELQSILDPDAEPGPEEAARIGALLRDYRFLLGSDVVRLAVTTVYGNVVAISPGASDLLGKKHPASEILAGWDYGFSNVYSGEADTPTVIVVSQVQARPRDGPKSGAPRGNIVAELNLQRAASAFPAPQGPSDDLYLVDTAGKVILSTTDIADSGRDLGADPLVAGILGGRPFSGEAPDPRSKGARLIASAFIAPTSWYAIASTNTSDPDVELTLGQLQFVRLALVGVLLLGSLLFARAASEVVRQRRALRETNAALSQAHGTIQAQADQLAVASRHKSEFLANMSHELRTPLNAIIGFSEVLLARMFGELNVKQTEYLQDVASSGQHLLSLINEILDLSKVEAGKMELELSRVSLAESLASGLAMIRDRAGAHGISLAVDCADGLDAVEADPRKLRQVIFNLLSNAVKFTPDGGRIDLVARKRDGQAEVSVRDSGVGIAPEEQAKIFEEFGQAASARGQEGTGLGLPLAKRLVELHGGRMWLESAPGAGSTFSFALPLDHSAP